MVNNLQSVFIICEGYAKICYEINHPQISPLRRVVILKLKKGQWTCSNKAEPELKTSSGLLLFIIVLYLFKKLSFTVIIKILILRKYLLEKEDNRMMNFIPLCVPK